MHQEEKVSPAGKFWKDVEEKGEEVHGGGNTLERKFMSNKEKECQLTKEKFNCEKGTKSASKKKKKRPSTFL